MPIADDDDGQPVSPESPEAVIVDSDIPDDVAVDVKEEEEEEDDVSWSWLSAEQKLCSNTGSFTVPRYIDGSPVDLKTVPSYADFVTPSSYMAQKKRQLLRKNYADIKEVYSGITEEDKAFLTLYQSQEDKFSYLVGKKRKEATQQEKRQFAKQFLEASRPNANPGSTMTSSSLLTCVSSRSGIMLLVAGFLPSRRTRTVTSLSVRHAGC